MDVDSIITISLDNVNVIYIIAIFSLLLYILMSFFALFNYNASKKDATTALRIINLFLNFFTQVCEVFTDILLY